MQTLEEIEKRVRASLNTYNVEKSDDWIRQRARQLWEKQQTEASVSAPVLAETTTVNPTTPVAAVADVVHADLPAVTPSVALSKTDVVVKPATPSLTDIEAPNQQPDIEGLVTALLTSDPAERQRARDALIELRDIRAVDPLIATLQDKRWEVRCAAAKILGHIGDQRAIQALTDALSDPSLSVKVAAAEAVESLSDL